MRDKLLRVLDVNFNRCKEGLRVVEDVFRFVVEDDSLRTRIRALRHSLDEFAQGPLMKEALARRNARADIGKKPDSLENRRRDVADIVYANFQRAKESLRVIEECLKILAPGHVKQIKAARYKVYSIEKEVLSVIKECAR